MIILDFNRRLKLYLLMSSMMLFGQTLALKCLVQFASKVDFLILKKKNVICIAVKLPGNEIWIP